jgi:hypothetical protein
MDKMSPKMRCCDNDRLNNSKIFGGVIAAAEMILKISCSSYSASMIGEIKPKIERVTMKAKIIKK